MSPCFDKYVMENPIEADRTPARLIAAIQIFVQNVMPHFAEKRLLSARAHAATIEVSEASEENGEEYAKEFAAFQAFKKSAAMSKTNPVTSAWVAPSGPPRASDPLYCWSHGRGHASGGEVNPCRNPKPGHQFDAIYRNQKNGRKVK